MRSPAQHPQTLQTLGDGSAEVMPYAQPAGEPPHGQGYYVVPTQMMPYSSEQEACLSQCQMPYGYNWMMNQTVWQESNVNFAQGMIPPVLHGNPPNAMGQYESDGSSAAYYSENDDDDDTTIYGEPRVPPQDMETCPFSLTYP